MNGKENEMEHGGMAGPVEYFDEPVPGQFHSLNAETDMWEAFVLVLDVKRQSMYTECTVVPGSMDALQGGPDDLLIRNPDRNGFWILDFSQVRTMRADALLPGFAALAPRALDRVRKALDLYRKEEASAEYRYGIPFIGETDPRRSCHRELGALMETANRDAERLYWDRLAVSFRWTPGESDPGDLAAGFTTGSETFADIGVTACKIGLFDMLSNLIPPSMAAARMSSEARERTQKRERKLVFFPENIPGAAILLRFDMENRTILAEVSAGAQDKRMFEGIQLRRSPDGHVLGTIRNGSMKAESAPDCSETGIYFSRPGDVPLKGKWEVV